MRSSYRLSVFTFLIINLILSLLLNPVLVALLLIVSLMILAFVAGLSLKLEDSLEGFGFCGTRPILISLKLIALSSLSM
ncbi:hypothetical protein LINPERHAP1_LOCUS22395 [Linum perenne]